MKSARNWPEAQTPRRVAEQSRSRFFVRGAVFSLFLSAFLLTGAGCEVPLRWDALPAGPTSTVETTAPAWTEVEPGIARFDHRLSRDGAAARLVVWRFTSEASLDWRAATTSSGFATVSHWMDDDPGALLVLNGGYFHPDGTPSGWLRIDDEAVGARAFDAGRSGVLLLGTHPVLRPGAPPNGPGVDGLQSFPWLVVEGAPAFTQETGQYGRRTFVGTDEAGSWYVGVVPDESVTLYQLARLLPEMGVAWERVLNLDGGPSTGLVARFEGGEDRFDSFAPVAYAIVARRVPAAESR